MEIKSNTGYLTVLLTITAGFCDTVTFVAADSVFSAHVTGNFIVFAYQIVKESDIYAWIKLLTFPFFILGVIIGGKIARKNTDQYLILYWEAVILTISGAISCILSYSENLSQWVVYTVVMATVFAMGLQNAFGKLYAKETHGPTTMMTGNVTQASLDLGNLIQNKLKDTEALLSFKKQVITITGFLAGCFLGAAAGKFYGLGTLILPGTGLIVGCMYRRRQ